MPEGWDGLVSQHLNRKLSRPIARFLAKHVKATPNQISLLSFLVGIISGVFFSLNNSILGGLLAQTSSILDGVDGDLAILTKQTSEFGAFLDSVLDRYADAAIIIGMLYPFLAEKSVIGVLVGATALLGSLLVSYSRARVYKGIIYKGISGYAANRDIRLFIIMLGGLLNQVFYTLLILTLVTNLVVIRRIYDLNNLGEIE